MKIHERVYSQPTNEKQQDRSLAYEDLFFKLSGDEFYWQHQEQLQSCELTFDNPIEFQKMKTSFKVSRESSSSQLMCEENCSIQVTTSTFLPVLTLKAQKPHMKYSPLESENVLSEIKRISYLSPEATQKINDNTPVDPILGKQTPGLISQLELKKHHLYKSNQEAELTLNTLGLEKNEEKELVDKIKSYLISKKIALKKLIINGAHYDRPY